MRSEQMRKWRRSTDNPFNESYCKEKRDFPGGPLVKTLHFQCREAWVQSLGRVGTKDPTCCTTQARSQNITKEMICERNRTVVMEGVS